jgi:hypothetical protein
MMFEKPTLMSFAQNGHEAPAHYIQAALAGLRVVADGRERVGRRYVPTGRDIGAGPMRWDREEEFDLADVGCFDDVN